jgi:hypothetical protein
MIRSVEPSVRPDEYAVREPLPIRMGGHGSAFALGSLTGSWKWRQRNIQVTMVQ